jgi:MscS family membrane protein
LEGEFIKLMVYRNARMMLWIMLVLLPWGMLVERVAAQETIDPARAIPSPLEPANTASPRDTLQSFLKYANDAVRRWRNGLSGQEFSRRKMLLSIGNAQRCLDLSELPEATRFQLGLEKGLLLKELLDRIDIPPWKKIPGKEEVAAKGITRWTLPGTELTIARMEEGPDAGEFLFSADTVRRLGQFYDLARNLPYKPGATEDVYEL